MKWIDEITRDHDLHTDLNLTRDLEGNRESICIVKSIGRNPMSGFMDESSIYETLIGMVSYKTEGIGITKRASNSPLMANRLDTKSDAKMVNQTAK